MLRLRPTEGKDDTTQPQQRWPIEPDTGGPGSIGERSGRGGGLVGLAEDVGHRVVAEGEPEHGGVLHVDAVQAFGKVPFDMSDLHIDLLSVSAHKVGGPKGVGALLIGDGVSGPAPLLRGGGQELSRRAGTENVIGIAGFSAASRAAVAALPAMADITELRRNLEAGLRQHNGVTVFAQDAPRLPNTILFGAPGLRAETAVIGFDLEGIAVSSGSACSSGKVQPSHVVAAMGFGPELTRSAIRLSLGWSSTRKDVDRCLEAWKKLSGTLLKQSDETEVERF